MTGAALPPGPFLALDTSCPVGHVAVGRGSEVFARERLETSGRQAAELVPAIARALDAAGLTLAELQGIVVGEGPGSFTGVRVAAATAKGLSMGAALPLWGVSSLAAAALADGGSGIRVVLFDARAERVYAGAFVVGAAGVATLVPPHASDVATVLAGSVPAEALFVGDGAVRHRARIEAADFRVAGPPAGEPTGDALLAYLQRHPGLAPLDEPGLWEPAYLKPSSAERAWTA